MKHDMKQEKAANTSPRESNKPAAAAAAARDAILSDDSLR